MKSVSPATLGNTGDAKEIARFNALAATWWNPSGPMWPLHKMNEFRVQVILDVLHVQGLIDRHQPQPLQGLQVLDIGCGGGILSEALARLGARVTGIDLAERNIRIAQQHAASSGLNIEYRVQDVTQLRESFDLIFNMEVVEHVGDLPTFMQACQAQLKPGGITIASTINRTLLSYLIAILGAEYVLKLLPKGTHRWRKFVTPQELETLLNAGGVDCFWRAGIRVNPWRRSFALHPSMAVNYMLAGKKQAWLAV
ncbi:MAG TPA: bifunctional 2-polyprenyl-6-hydroxyphenol methylase/3-demethylubiquinol 3-O-methyltransferase UbiG [Candidatus Kapabacteria bacterium]|nr:bifunctional 2-polyprenyl-6-hydroxyphenol methylase/3-demethylubiquinol 3-O-methyltransferase UbiG [Candidatus Kapabacteria bacterium]